MKSIIKNIPFHSFLIAPSLIFFLFVHNYQITSFKSTLRSYEVSVLFSAIIFLVFYFLLKRKKHKAGVVTTSLMLILFFYGFMYEVAEKLFYKGWWPFAEIHRYLLLVIFLFTALLCYFLFRTKRTFHSLTFAFNIFVLILFLVNFFRLAVSLSKADSKITSSKINGLPNKDSLPDIYYIILDGYANDSMLSIVYHYPKNTLTGYLKERNFFIATDSRANYIYTSPSLSSSLNYSYLDSMGENLQEKKNIIYDNKVSGYLKKNGYKIVHVRSGYSVTRENQYADTIISLRGVN